jgi:aminoglycoside 2'-N-acetyltransferase I
VTVVTLHTAPSEALPPSLLRDLRSLLDAAFPGDFTDDDWAHALGGVHVWLTGSDGVIGHGSLVERTLECSGHRLRVGFVEAVATAPEHRHAGHGARVIAQINGLIHARYPLGALSTGAFRFYEGLGWERWRGPTFVDSPAGRRRTPNDDGSVMILRTPRTPAVDVEGGIVCDWRPGDVW